MKGKIRNIYPGGNTPDGFYSYYNYILPQREAQKFFCIKGGPGTGKSTFMRSIGEHFADKGEDVDFLWCSSDPGSLDGVLLKERRAAIVDGTAPHIVDPRNPGAVDEIINLGEYWDQESIRKQRDRIISLNEMIGEIFQHAYGYLRSAGEKYRFMAEIYEKTIPYEEIREYRNQLQLKLDGVSLLRRSESKARKDTVLGRRVYSGQRKKAFAGAITPGGIRSGLLSIIGDMEKVILLDSPVGFRTEKLLAPVSERLTDAGFDVEEYYCTMDPENRLEHIVCPGAGLAVAAVNRYHDIDTDKLSGKVIKLKIENKPAGSLGKMYSDTLTKLYSSCDEEIKNAAALLETAKAQHDILEGYYAPNMNFGLIEKKKEKVINMIENGDD